MKQSLQIKMGQQLTMTPQLQQAIRLLQLSSLDLQAEVQEALESNPMLELEEEGDQGKNNENSDSTETTNELSTADTNLDEPHGDEATSYEDSDYQDNTSSDITASGESGSTEVDMNQEQMPDELPVDSAWDDVYQPSMPASSGGGEDGNFDFESRNSASESLQDHLLWQLNLTPMSDVDRVIAMSLIDGINDEGYLTLDIDDMLESMNQSLANEDVEIENLIERDEIEAVLHRIQRFDPPGIGARDLQECLQLQLQILPESTPWLPQAKKLVSQHLALLGSRDYTQVMKLMRLKEPELKDTITLIQSLNPKPGSDIAPENTEYVVPDVKVEKKNGRWRVELNSEAAPKVRINTSYSSLVKKTQSSADTTYLRNHLQEARWLIKSLESRNETLLKVSSQIVEYQRGFLEYGEEAMKPLVLHDIAEIVGMHESTISRVTTQKYMHTPRGIFELKYFFSSHVSTSSGGECSSTAIRALIKKLVAAENPRKPLSDSKIANLLEEQGIQVARRTIAKYREAMIIPPSNERKRLV